MPVDIRSQSSEAKVISGAIESALGPIDAARLSVKDTFELDVESPGWLVLGARGHERGSGRGDHLPGTRAADRRSRSGATKPSRSWTFFRPIAISRRSASTGTHRKRTRDSAPAGIWVVAVKPDSEAAKDRERSR